MVVVLDDVRNNIICIARVGFHLFIYNILVSLFLPQSLAHVKQKVAYIKPISDFLFMLPDAAQYIVQERFYIPSVASVFSVTEPEDVVSKF